MNKWMVAAVLAAGAMWVWAVRAPDGAGAGRIASPRTGFPAPDFVLPLASGQEVSLADFRGQVVILNLWASWCLPCRAEMPAIEAVYTAQRERGLTVLAVNSTYQDSMDRALAFVDELGVTFPILLDHEGRVSKRYLLRALPTTFFIDRRGVIREVIVGGPMPASTLQSQVEALLAEAP